MKKHLFISLFSTTLLLAGPGQKADKEIQEVNAIGQKASAALLKTLGGNLQKHLKAEGPMGALNFCSDQAYALTEKVDKSLGSDVSVKRISLKYRNPANAPEKDEKAVLQALQTLKSNGVVIPASLVQNVGNGTYKYYKPLLINKAACLKCHGDLGKNPELKKAIHARYPNDMATGYKMNDLRGAVVVTVKE
jgi:hypothetical protein